MLRQRCSARLARSSSLSTSLGNTLRCFSGLEVTQSRIKPVSKRQIKPTLSAERHFTSTNQAKDDVLHELALSHHLPSDPGGEKCNESLRAHLVVSLLAVNQQCTLSSPSRAQPASPQLRMARAVNAPDEEVEAGPSASMDDINGLGEPVVGVVSPIEGGDCYNRDAVLQVAQRLDAEVLRIDLALALGLSGPSGPLGLKGKASNTEITGKPLPDITDDQVGRSSQTKQTPC